MVAVMADNTDVDVDVDVKTVKIKITGNNISVTDSLREYVDKKISKVINKYKSILTKVNVHLEVDKNPAVPNPHKCEVVAFAGKVILRAEVKSQGMYASIDEVEVRISRTIRKFKERRTGRSRKDLPAAAIGSDDDDADDGPEDTYAASDSSSNSNSNGVPLLKGIVRRKTFPMPVQSVEEAVLCLEYLDHGFYLFRNEKTMDISLVYKRNNGGYGLVDCGAD